MDRVHEGAARGPRKPGGGRPGRSGRAVLWLALGLFALHLALAVPQVVATAFSRLSEGVPHLGESPAAARRRVFGAPYSEAIAAIRRQLAPDAVYILINGDALEEGAPLWVRFDLAPHRAIYFGRLATLPPRIRRAFPRGPQWVVLTRRQGEPPLLVERNAFLTWFETPGRTDLPFAADALRPAG